MCHTGYLGSDCSVRADTGPQLMGIDEGHMCDVNQTDCSIVTLRGYSFVDSQALNCRFQPAKVCGLITFSDHTLLYMLASHKGNEVYW